MLAAVSKEIRQQRREVSLLEAVFNAQASAYYGPVDLVIAHSASPFRRSCANQRKVSMLCSSIFLGVGEGAARLQADTIGLLFRWLLQCSCTTVVCKF